MQEEAYKNKPGVEGVASSVVQYLSSMLKTLQHKGKKKKKKQNELKMNKYNYLQRLSEKTITRIQMVARFGSILFYVSLSFKHANYFYNFKSISKRI